jgi:hypothetical protein
VEFVGPGRVEVRPARSGTDLAGFVGCLKTAGTRKLSLEEMKKIARQGWAGGR